MAPIIKQNHDIPRLPDLRNVGVLLRIVLIVNAAAFAAAYIESVSWPGLVANWAETAALVEPQLILEIVLLYGLMPVFGRLEYRRAWLLLLGVSLAVAELIYQLFAWGWPDMAGWHPRQLALSLAVVVLLSAYFNLRARALSPALAEARLQALQARIRPHFLFNSINAVLSLVRSEPQRAETALQDLAELYRVLMADNRDLKPLGDEVELCRQYLDLEKLRLGERLRVIWHTDNMPERALIPPMVLQPLLENAVYHGIEPMIDPGEIGINIFLRRGSVHAVLSNPYQSARGTTRSGNKMAIDNIRERLALHFDAEARLETRIKRDSYRVHITMPYRELPPVRSV